MTRHRRLLTIAVTAGMAAAVAVTVGMAAAITTASAAQSGGGSRGQDIVQVQLSGLAETPLALSSPASGRFTLRIDSKAQRITYRLSYSAFATAVTQAHVHFGSPAQTGGISFFLCSNLGNGPAGTQACPAGPATISGTITSVDIIGPTGQGIGVGEFTKIVDAVHAGFTYVNVHTTAFPGGEIRSQLGHQH